jgi:regulator of protease activity HflC (stomatin/prohibitin superfamily)
MIIITIVLLLVALGALAYGVFGVARARDQATYNAAYQEAPPPDAPRWPWVLSGVAFVLFLLSLGLIQIQPGRVGVVANLGVVQEQELPPGIHYVIPVINNVTEFDTRVRAVRIEGYTAASLEQQDLFLNLTLNYHVIPTEASVIVSTIGTDFEQKVVMPRLLDIPKSITDDYRTAVVLNSRDEIRVKTVELLSSALQPYGLVVDTINLENFAYSPEYNAAIEARAVAEQQVQVRQQELEQARVQAEQARVVAEGVANARIEEARGEAEANRLLDQSLTAELIQWQAINKLQDNVEIMLVPSDGGLILDVSKLRGEGP